MDDILALQVRLRQLDDETLMRELEKARLALDEHDARRPWLRRQLDEMAQEMLDRHLGKNR